MISKGRLKVLAVCSIFALLLDLIATIGTLSTLSAMKVASSLDYHGLDHIGSEYHCLSAGTTRFFGSSYAQIVLAQMPGSHSLFAKGEKT